MFQDDAAASVPARSANGINRRARLLSEVHSVASDGVVEFVAAGVILTITLSGPSRLALGTSVTNCMQFLPGCDKDAGIIPGAMGDLTRHGKRDVAAGSDAGNLDGKGLNGFLLDWHRSEPRGVVAKPRRQVLSEFFTSMLVLSAKFRYEPAVGVRNYLYFDSGDWVLSMIGPDEWSPGKRDSYVGTCILQRDMTWTIEPSDRLGEDNELSEAVGRFYDAFAELFDADSTIGEILPFYVGELPYYQRLYASALSRSIRATVTLGDQRSMRCRDWRAMLPALENAVLAHKA